MKSNEAGEAISGHFLRAILPSVNEQFQRILLPLPFLNIKFRKICMSVLVLCRYQCSDLITLDIVKPLGTKNRSRANCVPIYGDLYQNLKRSLTLNLKVVTHLKSASEACYDVTNMATIIRNCPLIKAIVCVGMVIFIRHERFFNIISIILVI